MEGNGAEGIPAKLNPAELEVQGARDFPWGSSKIDISLVTHQTAGL